MSITQKLNKVNQFKHHMSSKADWGLLFMCYEPVNWDVFNYYSVLKLMKWDNH